MTRTLASAVLLLFAVTAAGQPDDGRPPFIPPKDANFELFRGLLHFYGVEPVSVDDLVAMRDRDFARVIVVVLGGSDRRGAGGFDRYTKRAILNGGAVLIATDREANLTGYFPRSPNGAAVAVTGDEVVPALERDCYAGRAAFPLLLMTTPDDGGDDPLVGLFAGRPRIAANRPSAIARDGFHAYLPREVAFTPRAFNNPRGSLVAVGGVGDRRNPYRALALADPDVLSNQMLYSSGLPDESGRGTDNWVFANDLVKNFLRDPNGRDKCLFVENGQVIDTFNDVELKSVQQMPPIPPIPLPNPLDRRVQAKMAELIDDGVATLEDRTIADNLLTGPPNAPSPRRYQTTLMVMATAAGVVLVALMARRLLAARQRKNYVPAPSDPLFLGDDTALGSFGQRRAELLRGTDFRGPVAHRIRSLFAARGLPAGYAGRRLPSVEYRGRGDRERLGGDLRDLWDVARDEGVPLPYSEWKDLEPVLAEVHAAAAADRWRFAPTSTPPQGPA